MGGVPLWTLVRWVPVLDVVQGATEVEAEASASGVMNLDWEVLEFWPESTHFFVLHSQTLGWLA
jgi:hypothetical protein